jgi:BirA family transcriptional regulator, biotin operon repressor / biotin---[acetyl-CoA-carboxylase] ligase
VSVPAPLARPPAEGVPRFRRLALGTVASTNDETRALAETGEPEGLVVTARSQTRGRGRHGRAWASPEGNLHASILLRPACPLASAGEIGLVAAVALAEALLELGPEGLPLGLKWPNDVLIGRRKVAGILLESAAGLGQSCDWLILGTGVNVVACPGGLPYPATHLAAEGFAGVDADAVLDAYLAALGPWYARWRRAGLAPVQAAWTTRAQGLGERVRLRLGERVLEGRFAGLGPQGALRLEEATGRVLLVTTGEVFFEAP